MSGLKGEIVWCSRVQWILAGALIFCLAGFYIAGWRPMTARQRDLKMQIAVKHRDLDANQTRARTLPHVAMEVERLKARLARFDKRLPRRQGMTQFIDDLTPLSQESNLARLTTEPAAPRRSELFGEQPITLTFEGRFPDAFAFLKKAEEMERLTRVKNLQIRSVDAQQGLVSVRVELSRYFSEE